MKLQSMRVGCSLMDSRLSACITRPCVRLCQSIKRVLVHLRLDGHDEIMHEYRGTSAVLGRDLRISVHHSAHAA